MKKLIIALLLLSAFNAVANEFIYNDFWYAAKPLQLKLKVEGLQDSLKEECSEHYKTIKNFSEFNAEDVAFYNSLPLKKQMGSRFSSVFRIKGLSSQGMTTSSKAKSPLLKLDFGSYSVDLLKAAVKISSYSSESLSALSANAGAAIKAPEFKTNSVLSDEILLTIERRDVACDLINQRIQLIVTVPVNYTLSEESQQKIQLYMDHLGRNIYSILNQNESSYVKAAKIGLMAAELQTTAQTSMQLVEYIFSKLFINNSLELSARWSQHTDGSFHLLPEFSSTELANNILIEL